MVMRKRKSKTYRIWRDGGVRGERDDTVRSFQSLTPAVKHAIALNKRKKFTAVAISTGRGISSERILSNPERKKWNAKIAELRKRRKR